VRPSAACSSVGHGSCVNSRDTQGKSSVHHLVETYYGNPRKAHDIVELLIQHGADVNLRDYSGRTPLHGAAVKDWTLRPLWQVAGELMKAGADRLAVAEDGRTPLDMVPDGVCAETQRIFLRSQEECAHTAFGYN
jgi:ankyrin repeat protein